MRRSEAIPILAVLFVAIAVVWPRPLAAQRSGEGYLFGAPSATLSVYGGFGQPNASSDVFDDITSLLTVDRGDFAGLTLGGGLAIAVTPRLDVGFDLSYTGETASSEFRDWVDQDDLPIEQTTKFQRFPITINAKYYVLPRGRMIGSLAWVPSQLAPYVGAGAGLMWYRLQQRGDFVEFQDYTVFFDDYESSGVGPVGRLFGGVDLSITENIALTAEAGYLWSRTDLSQDFQGYEPIDLSGASATVGISLRI